MTAAFSSISTFYMSALSIICRGLRSQDGTIGWSHSVSQRLGGSKSASIQLSHMHARSWRSPLSLATLYSVLRLRCPTTRNRKFASFHADGDHSLLRRHWLRDTATLAQSCTVSGAASSLTSEQQTTQRAGRAPLEKQPSLLEIAEGFTGVAMNGTRLPPRLRAPRCTR